MIWLAAAAIATGLIAMLLPITMPLQICSSLCWRSLPSMLAAAGSHLTP